jgi:oleandomycin transport system permease protein
LFTQECNSAYVDFEVNKLRRLRLLAHPRILAQSTVFGSAPTAYGLNNDITKGVLDRSLPMARSAVLTGCTLPDLVRSTFILSLQLAVGILLGFRCHNGITGLLVLQPDVAT